MLFLWGGGGSFFGEVRWYVFLSLLGRGLAGVLPLGFLAGGCVWVADFVGRFWVGADSPSFCLIVNRYLLV